MDKAPESKMLTAVGRIMVAIGYLFAGLLGAVSMAFVAAIPVLIASLVLLILRLPLRLLLWGQVLFWYCIFLAATAFTAGFRFGTNPWPGKAGKHAALFGGLLYFAMGNALLIVAFIIWLHPLN